MNVITTDKKLFCISDGHIDKNTSCMINPHGGELFFRFTPEITLSSNKFVVVVLNNEMNNFKMALIESLMSLELRVNSFVSDNLMHLEVEGFLRLLIRKGKLKHIYLTINGIDRETRLPKLFEGLLHCHDDKEELSQSSVDGTIGAESNKCSQVRNVSSPHVYTSQDKTSDEGKMLHGIGLNFRHKCDVSRWGPVWSYCGLQQLELCFCSRIQVFGM